MAEAKRAKKEALRQKKRAANEAQQLDTPFYVPVAQGGPKARFRPPVPMVPSRITERLSSAAVSEIGGGGGGGTAANTRLEFGALVINSPASDCLLAAGITEPTGIQKAGMGPILDGESVILHAMTGSGKTLTFLLPLMQRWTPGLCSPAGAGTGAPGGVNAGEHGAGNGADGGGGKAPWQVMLALPTRELAVQVAREVVLLSGGLTSSVELLVDASVFHDLSKVTAPIVVGSAKVLERCVFDHAALFVSAPAAYFIIYSARVLVVAVFLFSLCCSLNYTAFLCMVLRVCFISLYRVCFGALSRLAVWLGCRLGRRRGFFPRLVWGELRVQYTCKITLAEHV